MSLQVPSRLYRIQVCKIFIPECQFTIERIEPDRAHKDIAPHCNVGITRDEIPEIRECYKAYRCSNNEEKKEGAQKECIVLRQLDPPDLFEGGVVNYRKSLYIASVTIFLIVLCQFLLTSASCKDNN